MAETAIEWCDVVWNPVRGCARVSPGCEHCYAEGQAHRFSGRGQPYEGLTVLGKRGVRWAGTARFIPEMLGKPLKWRTPRKVFVNSMSDLFHEDVTDEQIAAVFGVMAACPQHTFQVLTKRPERMVEWFKWLRDDCGGSPNTADEWAALGQSELGDGSEESETKAFWLLRGRLAGVDNKVAWPLPNVWLGVSCEDQRRANERIPLLLQTPAAVRFVSAEPLLGPINFEDVVHRALGRDSLRVDDPGHWGAHPPERHLNWVIVGGESGHGARPCDAFWIRSIVNQCAGAGIACFVKQLGSRPYEGVLRGIDVNGEPFLGAWLELQDRKGGDPAEWAEELRVRQFPHEAHP